MSQKSSLLQPAQSVSWVLTLDSTGMERRQRRRYVFTQTKQSQIDAVINQGFVKTAAEIKPTLPRVLDAITTLTDVRVEGSNMIYMNEIASLYEVKDFKVIEEYARRKVCASEMRTSIV